MVQSFAAAARGVHGNLNVFFDAFLADVFVETLGAHTQFDARVLVEGLAGHNALWLSLLHHPFCGSIGHAFCRRVFQFSVCARRGAAFFGFAQDKCCAPYNIKALRCASC